LPPAGDKDQPGLFPARLLLDRLHLPQTPGPPFFHPNLQLKMNRLPNRARTCLRQLPVWMKLQVPVSVFHIQDWTAAPRLCMPGSRERQSANQTYGHASGSPQTAHSLVAKSSYDSSQRLSVGALDLNPGQRRHIQNVERSGYTARTDFLPPGGGCRIASLALLASLVLPLLMFFRFKSRATQKWGERATIALAPWHPCYAWT